MEMQNTHKRAEYQSIKKIGKFDLTCICVYVCTYFWCACVYFTIDQACGVHTAVCYLDLFTPVYTHTAEMEKKVYELKKYIKNLHETIPNVDLPTPPNTEPSRPTSAEIPAWVAKDLNIKIRPMVLVGTGSQCFVTCSLHTFGVIGCSTHAL